MRRRKLFRKLQKSVEKVAKANNTHEVLIVSNEVSTNLVLVLFVKNLFKPISQPSSFNSAAKKTVRFGLLRHCRGTFKKCDLERSLRAEHMVSFPKTTQNWRKSLVPDCVL